MRLWSEGRFLERLEEEIPAKWLREVQRLSVETAASGQRTAAALSYALPSLPLGRLATHRSLI